MEDSNERWENFFQQYMAIRAKPGVEALLSQLSSFIVQTAPSDFERWCVMVLEQAIQQTPANSSLFLKDKKAHFVASILRRVYPLPERLLPLLVRTAVYERNPSFNRYFLEPCLRTFGYRRVQEMLLEYLEQGTDAEKAGAAEVYYWAEVGITYQVLDNTGRRQPTAESQAAYNALADIRMRIRCQMLKEFVENENARVRHSMIGLFPLNPAYYPDELRELIPAAIDIARTHPDDYIRHYIENRLESN